MKRAKPDSQILVSVLTGGGDKPYAFGLATELIAKGAMLDIVGSDDLECPDFCDNPRVNFLNLRGSQRSDVNFGAKALRVLRYYSKLVCYAATAKPKLFHILWNNKFELFDRTLLMLYYKVLRKKIVLTVHNVNIGERDDTDSSLNKRSLRIQYRLADHIFVHTEKMKSELMDTFGVSAQSITVIPFGINNTVPQTRLTRAEARRRLDLRDDEKVALFFGNIAPYKGLEYLIEAYRCLFSEDNRYCLLIAGRPKDCDRYWSTVKNAIASMPNKRIRMTPTFIPDEETEVYFKAADVLVLPYRHIYQSGVLLLGYSFGLPVVAADVGSLNEEIVEGKTGFLFKKEDSFALAETLRKYFTSDLFADLEEHRAEIKAYANERYSWSIVGEKLTAIYAALLQRPRTVNRRATGATKVDLS